MKMMRTLLAVSAVLTLAACMPEPVQTVEKTYEITALKPPKRFEVTVRDVETGQVHKSLSVSKRCGSWEKLRVGSIWTFKETVYRRSDGSTFVGVGVSSLCDRLDRGETGKDKS